MLEYRNVCTVLLLCINCKFDYTRPLRYGEYIKVRIGSEHQYDIRTCIVSDYFYNACEFTLVLRTKKPFYMMCKINNYLLVVYIAKFECFMLNECCSS